MADNDKAVDAVKAEGSGVQKVHVLYDTAIDDAELMFGMSAEDALVWREADTELDQNLWSASLREVATSQVSDLSGLLESEELFFSESTVNYESVSLDHRPGEYDDLWVYSGINVTVI